MTADTEPLDHPGHVFVACGRLESVVHDAAIVPTDRLFSVRRYWEAVLGGAPEVVKPPRWPADYARAAGQAPNWFIDVGDAASVGINKLSGRAVKVLDEIANSGLSIGSGRTKLRVAMPVLGVAGGGMAANKGGVIAALLRELGKAAARLDIDIVLVTPDQAVFSAAQSVRTSIDPWRLDSELLQHARDLGSIAADGHLALFLGAGVSVSAGLPTWTELLSLLAPGASDIASLPPLDQAQLLAKRTPNLGSRVASIIERAERPSLAHVLLAGLGCDEVVTTNYDQLYEQAVRATGRPITSVLPWQVTAAGHPWVLKMHGDVSRPDSIVLTRMQFVRYDAATRPAGSLLQSLLLTRHLLVVGASLNDDNVARLAYEVDEFRRAHNLTSNFGTFVDVDGIPARQELWSDQFTWINFPAQLFEARVRTMEIFLDAVAAHASTDASWLLDPRFSGLLSEEEAEVAADAHALYARAKHIGGSFGPLVEALTALGARTRSETPKPTAIARPTRREPPGNNSAMFGPAR